MAVALFTNQTIEEIIRAELSDKGGADYDVLDAVTIQMFIVKRLITEAEHTFQKITDNIYTINTDGEYYNHF